MIVDANGRPVPTAPHPAPMHILPVVELAAIVVALGLAAWRAWSTAGVLGLVVFACALVLRLAP